MSRRRIDVHHHVLPPFAKPGHVLFGSDWPFLPAPAIALFTGLLDGSDSLDESGRAAIDRGNAAALFREDC